MKKFSTLLTGGFLLLFTFCISNCLKAQTTHPEQFNFTELAQYEIEHGQMFKCKTCPNKEVDGGWKGLQTGGAIPPGAKIMRQDNLSNTTTPNTITAVSPAPAQNFLGYIDPGTSIPPDTHGAVGLNHVVTATNDFVIIHNKVGGAEISRVTLGSFFQNGGVFDPYLILDPYTNRFIFTCQTGGAAGRLFIAVSNTSDPTGTWTRQNFAPVSSLLSSFQPDHPYVGTDNKWVTISLRRFTTAGGFDGTMLFVLDKANLFAGTPIAFGTNAQTLESSFSTDQGDAPLPITAYGLTTPANTIYVLQAWNGGASMIRLSTITGTIPTMTWNRTTAAFPTGGTTWRDFPGTNFAPQLGETRLLSTNDSRFSCGVMVNGKIWGAHTIGLPATGTNHTAIQWWQLSTAGAVLQRGRVDDPAGLIFRYFPSIAVNPAEKVLIGYTTSSATTRVSAAYSTRDATTAANTTDDEFIYKTGLSVYWKDFNSGRARWGDYSHSALDPVTNTLWTIQEYADQRIGTTDNSSRYGVWWAEVGTPSGPAIARDASLNQIIDPNASAPYCNVPITPKVKILNAGTDTLKSVQVGMILDGVNLGSNTFTNLALPQFGSTIVTLTNISPTTGGTHILKVFTFNPNGLADQNTANDTSTVTFTILQTLPLPNTEGFESPIFPPPGGWSVSNPDGDITWTRTTAAAKTGVASMWINGFNYGTLDAVDIFKSPKIDLTKIDTLTVKFDVAYARYTAFPADDTLEVVYSLDCGVTWLPTGYKKWGAALATAPTNNTTLFVPTAAQWRNETVTMTNFCNIPSSSLMLGIKFVNEFGQALYIDNLNLSGSGFQRNLVMEGISQPNDICSNSFAPVISFTNRGADTVYSATINYSVDGGPNNTFTFTGTLPKCSTQVVTLPSLTAANGAHILTVYTSNPNGLPDQFPSNDTARKAFNISSTIINSPVTEGFENTAFPPPNWFVNNPDGSITWERTTAAAKTGAASMVIRNFNYPTSGTTDRFFSAIIKPAADVDSFFVSFDYAYAPGARYPGSTALPLDTLEVQITQDCGATYTTIWKKWGEDLQTLGDPNGPNYSSGIAFVPTASQWKNIRLYVSPVIRNQNFQVHFVAKSNRQNNLYVDNINIFSQTLPQRLKNQGYLLYPSPFTGSFRIHHFQAPVDLQSVGVYNSVGQKVWENNLNGQGNTEMFVNLGKLAAGVYIVKLQYLNKSVVERIVKL